MRLDKINDLFLECCYKSIKNQNEFGYMPSGHNGSYHDKETPVRNTAHWIISFTKAYNLTKRKCFYDAVVLALSYLKDKNLRPSGKSYICRIKESKDKCNGLIGQAWVIEGLIEGYNLTNDIEVYKLACDIFLLHPFCDKKNLWHRVEPNGKILSIDTTFNHQLWFAMSGLKIVKSQNNKLIKKRCFDFFNSIYKNIKIHKNGRIGQSIQLGFKEDIIKYNLKKILKRDQLKYMKLKEIGYHSFNTYAFSIINELYPEIDFFQSSSYIKILKYLCSNEYMENIYVSEYGFKYNPPGFEVLKTYLINKGYLSNISHFIQELLDYHIKYNFDHIKCSFVNNVHDKNTSSARIYELSSSL